MRGSVLARGDLVLLFKVYALFVDGYVYLLKFIFWFVGGEVHINIKFLFLCRKKLVILLLGGNIYLLKILNTLKTHE